MSFLYRAAITLTRKQPYIDWANSFDDGGPTLTADLAESTRTVYLVPEEPQPELLAFLDEFWEDIFEQELASWMESEDDWPPNRTREMFDAWFDAELTDAVYDLVPDHPLTHEQVELADLDYTIQHCAWCEAEVEPEAGRLVGFKLVDRSRIAHREGLTIALALDEERVVLGVVSPAESEPARAGEDVLFRACTSRCEKAIRKVVPKAMRASRFTTRS